MPRKLINLLVLLPVAIILIVLSVANRQSTTFALNPFRPDDAALSFTAPFFIFLFAAIIFGVILGSTATWLAHAKHRKKAKSAAKEAAHWRAQLERQNAPSIIMASPASGQ